MTVDELLTIEEIKLVQLDYCEYVDTHNLDALANLFTEDGVVDLGENYGVWVGKPTIVEQFTEQFRRIGQQFDAIHVVTNPRITVLGPDRAQGRWYLIDLLTRQKPVTELESPGGHANPLIWLAIYECQYRKIEGCWKIARMKFHYLWPSRDYKALEGVWN